MDANNVSKQAGLGKARHARVAFLTLFLAICGCGIVFFADFLWRTHLYGIKYAILILHSIMYCLISFVFCNALFGFIASWRQRNASCDEEQKAENDQPSAGLAPTAVLFPIFNEDVARVMAGVEATYLSMRRTGHESSFEFFVLSDSKDPDIWIEEEIAFFSVLRRLEAIGRLHFRHRSAAEGMKAGNIGDFLEKWGGIYRYMIILDADSVMCGPALVELVRRMERRPHVGIMQTLPGMIRSQSLYARMHQFANRIYGRLFMAGMDAWQQNSGNYVGHNAIIRIQPFMMNCRLPRLPWREPLGGQIFSHDFVEAALMSKGGYATQWAYDVEGSYEEGPANLLESARRHRRWCQGNLQHTWLLFSRDLPLLNRCHFLLGIMAYTSSLVWLCFLVMSTLAVIQFERSGLSLIPVGGFTFLSRFPLGVHGGIIFCFSLLLLFSPKYFSYIDLCLDRRMRQSFGGARPAAAGVLLESILSILLAPILMLWHAAFVITIPLGKGVTWTSQSRSQELALPWRDAARTHGWLTGIGFVWAALVAALGNLTFLLWMTPILVPLMLSIPLNVLLSSPVIGRRLRRAKIMLTPEENEPPPELGKLAEAEKRLARVLARGHGQAATVALVDPYVNALHVTLLRQMDSGDGGEAHKKDNGESLANLLKNGRRHVSREDFLGLLDSPDFCRRAHHEIWRADGGEIAGEWSTAIDTYSPARRIDYFADDPAPGGE